MKWTLAVMPKAVTGVKPGFKKVKYSIIVLENQIFGHLYFLKEDEHICGFQRSSLFFSGAFHELLDIVMLLWDFSRKGRSLLGGCLFQRIAISRKSFAIQATGNKCLDEDLPAGTKFEASEGRLELQNSFPSQCLVSKNSFGETDLNSRVIWFINKPKCVKHY